MTTALITCCNEALAQIAAGSIASLTEPSIEARECARFAPTLLAEMADWTEWHWLVRTVTLAQVSNDRLAEWNYAYAVPADMAQPLVIREVEDDADALPTYGPYNFPLQDAAPVRFIVEGGLIYTNVETARLVYTTSVLEAAAMPPLVRRAFVLELAARIALPVKKDAAIAQALQQQAEVARARAMADEQNKSPRMATRYVSEVEWARAGVGL